MSEVKRHKYGFGDDGWTSLFNRKERLPKDDKIILAIGSVNKFNAHLGMLLTKLRKKLYLSLAMIVSLLILIHVTLSFVTKTVLVTYLLVLFPFRLIVEITLTTSSLRPPFAPIYPSYSKLFIYPIGVLLSRFIFGDWQSSTLLILFLIFFDFGMILCSVIETIFPVISRLVIIQNCLFDIGSNLAGCSVELRDNEAQLTKEIEALESSKLLSQKKQKRFILPGSYFSETVSFCHLCVTLCRETEIVVVSTQSDCIPYFNRLSSYLFVLSRYLNCLLSFSKEIEYYSSGSKSVS